MKARPSTTKKMTVHSTVAVWKLRDTPGGAGQAPGGDVMGQEGRADGECDRDFAGQRDWATGVPETWGNVIRGVRAGVSGRDERFGGEAE